VINLALVRDLLPAVLSFLLKVVLSKLPLILAKQSNDFQLHQEMAKILIVDQLFEIWNSLSWTRSVQKEVLYWLDFYRWQYFLKRNLQKVVLCSFDFNPTEDLNFKTRLDFYKKWHPHIDSLYRKGVGTSNVGLDYKSAAQVLPLTLTWGGPVTSATLATENAKSLE
jgi:hypothetical protein